MTWLWRSTSRCPVPAAAMAAAMPRPPTSPPLIFQVHYWLVFFPFLLISSSSWSTFHLVFLAPLRRLCLISDCVKKIFKKIPAYSTGWWNATDTRQLVVVQPTQQLLFWPSFSSPFVLECAKCRSPRTMLLNKHLIFFFWSQRESVGIERKGASFARFLSSSRHIGNGKLDECSPLRCLSLYPI